MRLIDAHESGSTSRGKPDRTIDTVLSKIFFFGDTVLKVYKHRETSDSDMNDPERRKFFYDVDFNWNAAVAPEIYVALKGFDSKNDFAEVSHEEGDDWAIEMQRVDTSANLTRMLRAGEMKTEAFMKAAEAAIEKTEFLTAENKATLKDFFERKLHDAHAQMVDDLDEWLAFLPEVENAEREGIISNLKAAVQKEPYFKDFDPSSYRVVMDTNDDNILFIDGAPTFIDTMPPKERWRVHDPHLSLIRPAVDAAVLSDDLLAESVRPIRENAYGKLPKIAELVYEIHAAGIQWAYRLTLKQKELADKYRDYILPKLQELKSLI